MSEPIDPAEILAKPACNQTPWERGFSARMRGESGPRSVPRGDASWTERLIYRGYCDALRYMTGAADAE